MRVIDSTWIGEDPEDVLPPVALDYVRAYCPECNHDVVAQRNCLWAENGECWCYCECCHSHEAEMQWA